MLQSGIRVGLLKIILNYEFDKKNKYTFERGMTKPDFYILSGLWAIPMSVILKHGVDFRPSLHLHGDNWCLNHYPLFKGIDWSKFRLVKDTCRFLDYMDDDIFRNGYSLIDDCWLNC